MGKLGTALAGVVVVAVIGLRVYRITRLVGGGGSSGVSSLPAEVKGKTVDEIVAARATPTFPERPAAREVAPGITVSELTIHAPGPGGRTTLWLYTPTGDHKPAELPCVVIAPAGTHLVEGIGLADGDRDEHLPYVKAGFAVLAYSLDGDVDGDSLKELAGGARKFHAAGAGLVNFEVAMDYLKARAPEVDPKRIYVAGHSSAATMALVAAEHDPRVAACVAYAPCCDTAAHYNRYLSSTSFGDMVPEEGALMDEISPINHASAIKCPTLIFYAKDDRVIDTSQAERMGKKLAAADNKSKVVTVDRGGHFDSMVGQGIPAGIEFLRETCGALKH